MILLKLHPVMLDVSKLSQLSQHFFSLTVLNKKCSSFCKIQDSIYFSVLDAPHGCLNNPGMYIYTYVLNCSRKLKYLLRYSMNLSCCTRKYLTL